MLAAVAAFADETAPRVRARGRGQGTARENRARQARRADQRRLGDGCRVSHRLSGGSGHAGRPSQRMGRCRENVDQDQAKEDQQNRNRPDGASGGQNPTAEASMFYVAYFAKGARVGGAAGDVPVQRRPRIIDDVVAHGRFWSRSGSSLQTIRIRRPRPTRSSTMITAYSTRAISYSSTRPARASVESPARTRRKPSTASMPTPTPSRNSSPAFLSKYSRWNSPKYLFGESYGTTRSAALINLLETDRHVDFNGVILLSQILNFDLSADGPQFNPGVNLALSAGASDLCCDGLVPPQAAGHAQGLAGALGRGRAFRHDRLWLGAPGGGGAGSGPARCRRRQAARLYRTAGRIHQEGRSAHQWRRVRKEPCRTTATRRPAASTRGFPVRRWTR